MSMTGAMSRTITSGDHVILYEYWGKQNVIKITPGQVFGNQFGTFHHDDMIGKPYGSKIPSRGRTSGWIGILHPTPELWTSTLTHRTQILYQTDISLILTHLDICPGKIVVESGTGSGSLTTQFARSVAPHGHVWTFEYNQERAEKAIIDFKKNRLDQVVTIRCRDVCGRGFPMIMGGVDAVFLDLPTPWTVVENSKQLLRNQGRFCSFSPCIEQVQRTCVALDELGFTNIITFEVLIRTYEAVTNMYPDLDLGHNKKHNTATTSSKKRNHESEEKQETNKKIKTEETTTEENNTSSDTSKTETDTDMSTTPSTSTITAANTTTSPAPAPAPAPSPSPSHPAIIHPAYLPLTSTPSSTSSTPTRRSHLHARPFQQQRGHTGYLTFAVCLKQS